MLNTQPTNNNTYHITPLFAAMLTNNDKQPDNSLPIDTQGTVQENAHLLPAITLYNAHGILVNSDPNTLIARV